MGQCSCSLYTCHRHRQDHYHYHCHCCFHYYGYYYDHDHRDRRDHHNRQPRAAPSQEPQPSSISALSIRGLRWNVLQPCKIIRMQISAVLLGRGRKRGWYYYLLLLPLLLRLMTCYFSFYTPTTATYHHPSKPGLVQVHADCFTRENAKCSSHMLRYMGFYRGL